MKMLKIAVLLFLLLLAAPSDAKPRLQQLTVVLDWFINPDHAPLFVADEKGFFKEEGLDVRLINPADSNDPPKLVAAGQADIAITYEPQFIDQNNQGLPLLAFGILVDQPLDCLLLLGDGPVKSLADLKQKRIGGSSDGLKSLMLKTMLAKEGLTLKDVALIQVRHNLLQALLAHRVDAVSGAMRNIEAVQLQAFGHPARLILPEDHGLPPYSELIFVAHQNSLDDPAKRRALRHFLRALQKATVYLKRHPQECWLAFAQKYPALNNDFNHRSWNASLSYFTLHPEHFSKAEWRAFITFMRQNGLIQKQKSLADYFTEIKL